jgi:hypothetical protein
MSSVNCNRIFWLVLAVFLLFRLWMLIGALDLKSSLKSHSTMDLGCVDLFPLWIELNPADLSRHWIQMFSGLMFFSSWFWIRILLLIGILIPCYICHVRSHSTVEWSLTSLSFCGLDSQPLRDDLILKWNPNSDLITQLECSVLWRRQIEGTKEKIYAMRA